MPFFFIRRLQTVLRCIVALAPAFMPACPPARTGYWAWARVSECVCAKGARFSRAMEATANYIPSRGGCPSKELSVSANSVTNNWIDSLFDLPRRLAVKVRWPLIRSVGMRVLLFVCSLPTISAQLGVGNLMVSVMADSEPLPYANVYIAALDTGGQTDSLGQLKLNKLPAGKWQVAASFVGYFTQQQHIVVQAEKTSEVIFQLHPQELETVVVTGNMREMRRSESPIAVDIISSKLFLRNPSPNLFESVAMISGVQPVISCNVCNAGDIRINGLEGVYTQVLIDGMPIVSGLGTVYGLMGIPNSLIDRIEVVKGPAGALYGSEAMAGQINIITKRAEQAPRLSFDLFSTSWAEQHLDAGLKWQVGEKTSSLLGLNTFWFNKPIDKNGDGFTDVAQQKRVSLFNKWQWARPENRLAQFGARYVWEDRWGGQSTWTPAFRGGDELYGESIFTHRLEMFGTYQLPTAKPIFIQGSYNFHDQNSAYGNDLYLARQSIAFVQSYFDRQLGAHQLLGGLAIRYTHYNDNTPATSLADETLLPGAFLQNEWTYQAHNRLLGGLRLDVHPVHGAVWSPRLAIHQHLGEQASFRASVGSGFRVVNLFTEDHAALSGAREVVILESLQPERSWSGTLNYQKSINREHYFLQFDASAFYVHFSNQILPDYDSNPQQILYANLSGASISRGASLQLTYSDGWPLRFDLGVTYMDVFQTDEAGEKRQQIRAPRWSGTLTANYSHTPSRLSLDLTGNWFGPQRLPIVPNDFRPAYSPWFALLNAQVSRKMNTQWELYAGVKNLLNFIPQNPILRPFDPFDRLADDPISNPFGYTFDPNYNYAPLQGIRGFVGLRYRLK